MANCRFYLKQPEPALSKNKKQKADAGKRLIYLRFTYGGKQGVFSFGQKIYGKDWDKKKHRLKRNTHTTSDGKILLNDLLNNLERVFIETYNREIPNGYPEPQVIKDELAKYMNTSA